MDLQQLMLKLFELQQLASRKAALGIRVAENRAREAELSMKLDLYRATDIRFNEQGMLDLMAELRPEHAKVSAEYREVCEQYNALAAELAAELGATTPKAAV